jgi:cytochrome c-type biogenesis protein
VGSLEITAVFGAGTLTFLTPCVLPLLPIYLAILMGNAEQDGEQDGWRSRLRLFFNTLAFSAGMIGVFVALGLTATSVGSLLTEHRTELVLIGGLIVFLFGLKFLGVLRIERLDRDARLDGGRFKTRSQLVNALVMGVVFSLGWTPCVGPMLGSVLTYAASTSADPLRGAMLLAAYGLGFTLPLMLLSLFADGARKLIGRISSWLPRLEKAGGLLLIGVGLFMMLGVASPPSGTVSPAAASVSTTEGVAVTPALGEPTPRPRMVQFTSSECSICRQMIPTVALIERDCDGKQVDVVKVDVTTAEGNRRIASRFRVRGVPTFVFLDRGGNEAARLVGFQTLGSLRQALSAMVGEQCAGLGHFEPDSIPTAGKNQDRQPSCNSTPAQSRCES